MNLISDQTETLDNDELGSTHRAVAQDKASVSHTHSAVGRSARRRRFVSHYVEMVLAMVVGMVVLGMPEYAVVEALGWSGVLDRADLEVMVMATNMAVAMGGWMRFRGHDWAPIAEMVAAMYLPFAVLLVPLWAGAISEDALFLAGHVMMLPAMAAAMLLRRDEYTHTHHRHHKPARTQRAVDDAQAHRAVNGPGALLIRRTAP